MNVSKDYGTVARLFWRDPRMREAGDDGRLLALYLLTSPTGSFEGLYPLERALVLSHLGWTERRLRAALAKLAWFATYDEHAQAVYVHKALKYQVRPKGGPQLTGALKSLDRVQNAPGLFWRFLMGAAKYAPELAAAAREHYGIPSDAQPPDSALGRGSGEGMTEGMGEGISGNVPHPIPTHPIPTQPSTGRAAIAERCFAYWVERCSKPAHTIFTAERRKKVLERLAEGRTEADIRKAIDGAAIAPTKSDDGRRIFNDLELICRNGTKFESFMERGSKPRSTGEDFFARNAAAFASPSPLLEGTE